MALPLDEYCNALRQEACRPAVEPLPSSADVAVVSAARPSTKPVDGPPRHTSADYRLMCRKQLNVHLGSTGSPGTSCSCGATD